MEPKKRRYSFWKVTLWIALINLFLGGFTLVVIYFVPVPNNPTVDLHKFHLPHFLLQEVCSIIYQCAFYYFALNTYYRLLTTRKPWTNWLTVTLIVILVSGVASWLADLCTDKSFYKMQMVTATKIIGYVFSIIFQIGLTLLIVAITKQLDEKRWQNQNQKILEQRANKLEKEKIQADYLFLKAQINPHFLHNTLNFLYSRSLLYDEQLSEAILTLSDIMRYSLDKEEDAEGKVLLTREIEHVNNIIRLQQLRFDNSLQVVFTIDGDPEGRRILPFVLITLVENAFKHGDLKSPDLPARLELDISQAGRLHFVCSNKKKSGPKELSTGLGLENTRKRLELAYGDKYSLYIKDQRDLFTADLTINL